jgi:hypothetical protein
MRPPFRFCKRKPKGGAEIEGDTPAIMHPESLLHLVVDLPNQALFSNDEEIIDAQNDSVDNCALSLKQEQPSFHT